MVKLKGRSTSSKSFVFTGDWHCGSKYAIKTPFAKITDDDGDASESRQNPLQIKLWDAWNWSIDELEQRPHGVVMNGEPIDGSNHRSSGSSNWTTNANDTLKEAETLAKTFPTPSHWLITRGTPYHSERETTNFEEILAKRLNATPYRAYLSEKIKVERNSENFEGARTDYYMWFEVFGRLFSVTHHVGFTKWAAYRPTPIAREMASLEMERGKYYDENTHPTFVIRSHVHTFVGVQFGSSYGCTTPAWKFPDPYLLKGGLGGSASSIGNVEIIVEQDGKWTVRPHILPSKYYPRPQVLKL